MSRFLFVGGIAFVVDLGLLIVCRDGLGLPLWLSTALAFWISVIVSYFLQRYFAFGGSSSNWHSLWKYGLLLAFNSIATVLIVTLFESVGAGYIIGKIAATALITTWNFAAYKWWVFAPPRSATDDGDRSAA